MVRYCLALDCFITTEFIGGVQRLQLPQWNSVTADIISREICIDFSSSTDYPWRKNEMIWVNTTGTKQEDKKDKDRNGGIIRRMYTQHK